MSSPLLFELSLFLCHFCLHTFSLIIRIKKQMCEGHICTWNIVNTVCTMSLSWRCRQWFSKSRLKTLFTRIRFFQCSFCFQFLMQTHWWPSCGIVSMVLGWCMYKIQISTLLHGWGWACEWFREHICRRDSAPDTQSSGQCLFDSLNCIFTAYEFTIFSFIVWSILYIWDKYKV